MRIADRPDQYFGLYFNSRWQCFAVITDNVVDQRMWAKRYNLST